MNFGPFDSRDRAEDNVVGLVGIYNVYLRHKTFLFFGTEPFVRSLNAYSISKVRTTSSVTRNFYRICTHDDVIQQMQEIKDN